VTCAVAAYLAPITHVTSLSRFPERRSCVGGATYAPGMTPSMTTSYSIGGQEVREGVRIPFGSNRDHIRFSIDSVCVSAASPFEWRGEVKFAGATILTTEVVDDHNGAGRLAEAALTQRLVDLFSGPAD
jgi:hypothetical protein